MMPATNVIEDNWVEHDPAVHAPKEPDFAALVAAHWHDLNHYAIRLTRDRSASQDIVQETLRKPRCGCW